MSTLFLEIITVLVNAMYAFFFYFFITNFCDVRLWQKLQWN